MNFNSYQVCFYFGIRTLARPFSRVKILRKTHWEVIEEIFRKDFQENLK